jgi:hypothetical protein
MAGSELARKLKLKPGAQAAVIGAPEGYLAELEPLPAGASLGTHLAGALDWLQVFVTTSGELGKLVRKAAAALKPDGLLWMSFPKGSSGIQTDLSRDKGWEPLEGAELKWVTLASVNSTWSAFCLRPYRPGEPRQKGRWPEKG